MNNNTSFHPPDSIYQIHQKKFRILLWPERSVYWNLYRSGCPKNLHGQNGQVSKGYVNWKNQILPPETNKQRSLFGTTWRRFTKKQVSAMAKEILHRGIPAVKPPWFVFQGYLCSPPDHHSAIRARFLTKKTSRNSGRCYFAVKK